MTTDISKIRESLKNCEEVSLPYKFPQKCWIKYITIKGEDEIFYEGGEYIGMGDHKIFLHNKGKQLCAPTCIRSDEGEILYKSRFFIDNKKQSKCEEGKQELQIIIKQQQIIIKKTSEQIKNLETQLYEYKVNHYDMISQLEEQNKDIEELLCKEKKYKLVISKYIH
tara:strand:+ start:167 stop:667 length:501 start_codon:yes stop_codon:yes gene_type:complete